MPKRDLMLARLREIGVRFEADAEGTFYVWGSVAELPPPLDTGMGFFRGALEERVITVPGEFFDVNPGRERTGRSPLAPFVRFSFVPPIDTLRAGLDRLAGMIQETRP